MHMLSDNRFFFSLFFPFFFFEFLKARVVNLSNPCHMEGQALSLVANTATALAIRVVAMPASCLLKVEMGIGVKALLFWS